MGEQSSYSLDELVERTGYDRRTIAYYVQQGLLPRVGRRGRRTRYAQSFLDRLLYIKRVRELQDTGIMPAVTLAEIREAFVSHSADRIHKVAIGERKPEWGGEAISEQTARLIGPGDRAERALQRAGSADTTQVKKLFLSLEQRAVEGHKSQISNGAERWTQVPITENINLAVKGIRDSDMEMAAALGRALRSLGFDTD